MSVSKIDSAHISPILYVLIRALKSFNWQDQTLIGYFN